MKASNIFLTLAALFLLTTSVMAFRHGMLKLQIAMADEQVKVFELMRLKALASTPLEAAESMLYVQNYYPSGGKQSPGSRMDQIVEAARAGVIREIANHLRSKTAHDFGNDPAKWIKSLKEEPHN